jgi:hypothetical protein
LVRASGERKKFVTRYAIESVSPARPKNRKEEEEEEETIIPRDNHSKGEPF